MREGTAGREGGKEGDRGGKGGRLRHCKREYYVSNLLLRKVSLMFLFMLLFFLS